MSIFEGSVNACFGIPGFEKELWIKSALIAMLHTALRDLILDTSDDRVPSGLWEFKQRIMVK